MKTRITILWEEINFYQNQNITYKAEDVSRKKIRKEPLNEKKIKENEERIEKLFSAIMNY
ncbi:MAG: hypothetical protein A2W17_04745 [Planctomycetes bacterium RBG_16_41_13]|nr:MAG: hypothetical protein A2W17_04745 [Planctomycetes bacterium RBG_16_41_13]